MVPWRNLNTHGRFLFHKRFFKVDAFCFVSNVLHTKENNGIALETPIWNLEWKPLESFPLQVISIYLLLQTTKLNTITIKKPTQRMPRKKCHRRTTLGCVNDQTVYFSVKISLQFTGNILLLIAMKTILDLSQSSTVLKFLQTTVNALDIPTETDCPTSPYRIVNNFEPELVILSPQSS